MPLKLVHISDIHIGERFNGPARLLEMFSGLRGHDPGALTALDGFLYDLVDDDEAFELVVTGDLTVAGTEEQFAEAHDILRDEAEINGQRGSGIREVRTHIIPGNHDYGPFRLFKPIGRPSSAFRDYFDPHPNSDLAISLEYGWSVRFLRLDTTSDASTAAQVVARGSCVPQVEALEAQLNELGSCPPREVRVLLLHHPPSYDAYDFPYLLELDDESRDRIYEFVDVHNVAVLLSGHTHDASLRVQPHGSHTALHAVSGSTLHRTTADRHVGTRRHIPQSLLVHDLSEDEDRLVWQVQTFSRLQTTFESYDPGGDRVGRRAITFRPIASPNHL